MSLNKWSKFSMYLENKQNKDLIRINQRDKLNI